MASPFSVFRKNQKVMIATLGMLAMIAFVFLPIVMKQLDTRSTANPVVVETSQFGDVTEHHLAIMRNHRTRMASFLERLQIAVQQAGGSGQVAQQFASAIGPSTEHATITNWLFVEHAKQEGIEASKATVDELIRELTENCIPVNQLKTILSQVGINQYQLVEILRNEILALRYQRLFQESLTGTPPRQRWDYYTQLKQTATAELIPVAVEQYVDQIEDPDDETLQAFFEEHKENFANPASPVPGFHRPKNIAVRYFKVDYDKFNNPEAFSDEEIKAFYEKHKDIIDRMVPTQKEPDKTSDSSEQTPPSTDEPASETPAAEADAPADKPQDQDQAPPASPVDDEKAAEPAAGDGTSSATRKSPFILTAALKENEEAAPAQPDSDPSDTSAEEATSPLVPPEALPPKRTKPAEAEPPTVEAIEPTKTDEPVDPKDVTAGPVGNLIRFRLAMQKTAEIFNAIQENLQAYRSEYVRYEIQQEQDPEKKIEPPAQPDYEALAKQHGVTTDQTPLISQIEAMDLDIGRSVIDMRFPFYSYAYTDNLSNFVPATSSDMHGNRFMFWKTDESKAFVPKFEDEGVKAEVLKVWKLVQARAKALEAAKQMATEARQAGKSLGAVFGERSDLQVIETPPFSWMTRGNVPATTSSSPPPRLSQIEGVVTPGLDFMRTVFSMKEGELDTTMNQPKTFAYVVRVKEMAPPENALWAQFEVDPFNTYADLGTNDFRQTYQAWLQELRARAGVKWVRTPDEVPTR